MESLQGDVQQIGAQVAEIQGHVGKAVEEMKATIAHEFQSWSKWAEEVLSSQGDGGQAACTCDCAARMAELEKDTQAVLRRLGEAELKIQQQAGRLAQQAAQQPPGQPQRTDLEEAVEKLEEQMAEVNTKMPKL